MSLLEIQNMRTYYRVRKGEVRAVDGVDFHVDRGETVGLVGESGCGKTTLAFTVLRLLPSNARIVTGETRFAGELVFRAPLTDELRYVLAHNGSLDAVRSVLRQREEALRRDTNSPLADRLAPLLQDEEALIHRVKDYLEDGSSDPASVAKGLVNLLTRQEERMGRGFGTRLQRRAMEDRMRTLRWSQISMIFQSAMNAFNPVYRVGDQIDEALETHLDMTPEERKERIKELFRLVGMHAGRAKGYPHEFSGGMKQRAMIAMALACQPDLIIADEPTTALDVIMQDRILGEIRDLQEELKLAMMIITHDISVVAEVSDRMVIMYAGEVAEEGDIVAVFDRPAHPYTIGLMEAFPNVKGPKKRLRAIPGSPPDLIDPPSGCRFHPRCRFAQQICKEVPPTLYEVEPGHRARCHFAEDIFRGELA